MDQARSIQPAHRGRRVAWLAVKLAATSLLALLTAELGLRFLLFDDGDLARRFGARLRSAKHFTTRFEDAHWKLRYLFNPTESRAPNARADPLLGWTSSLYRPRTYEHVDFAALRGRRPVLLYGDSFAFCYTSRDDCWQGLLERSPLSEHYALINYGTSGHGLDQTYLQLAATIDLYAELDPIVVVSMLVDDDLDRCSLAMREWPKPRFTLDSERRLVAHPADFGRTRDEYIASHPVGIPSYLWRFLVCGSGLVSAPTRDELTGIDAIQANSREVGGRLLARARNELRARGLEHFVLLFHGEAYMPPNVPRDWREPFVLAELERLGLPYVSSRPRLLEDARRTGRASAEYLIPRGPGVNHYTALGNQVVFRALEDGLRGAFDNGTLRMHALAPAEVEARGDASAAFARLEIGLRPPHRLEEDFERLCFRVGPHGPARLHYEIPGGVRRFKARLKSSSDDGHARVPSLGTLEILADGASVFRAEVAPRAAPIEIDLTLPDVSSLTFVASAAPDGCRGNLLYLASPELEAPPKLPPVAREARAKRTKRK